MVILASVAWQWFACKPGEGPNTLAHSLKLRLVVMRCLTGFCVANAEKDHAGALIKYAEKVDGGGSENSPGDCFPDDTWHHWRC